tara:strand:- start:224 stop:367 length:144 start_codon:yes stop_codon:yes gene_type:complete
MLKKILLSSALFLSACSNIKDEPFPVTSSSEKAVEFFNKAVYHVEQG